MVEDFPEIARVMGAWLQSMGHHPTIARSVHDARRALDGQPFDLVISDFGLPDGTGSDVRREADLHGSIPAILLTAYTELVGQCGQLGFRRCFAKPVDFQELTAAMDEIAA